MLQVQVNNATANPVEEDEERTMEVQNLCPASAVLKKMTWFSVVLQALVTAQSSLLLLIFLAARSSLLYGQQQYFSLQQQTLHSQLGMSSSGNSGLMLQGEPHTTRVVQAIIDALGVPIIVQVLGDSSMKAQAMVAKLVAAISNYSSSCCPGSSSASCSIKSWRINQMCNLLAEIRDHLSHSTAKWAPIFRANVNNFINFFMYNIGWIHGKDQLESE